jgi:methylaspartate ammonia-lyase
MRIEQVILAPGKTGFFFDDQVAIRENAIPDGASYLGEAVTDGFTAVRQAGEAISVLLVLEDGQLAHGDCAAVQYSGAAGRDPLFLAKNYLPQIEQYIAPRLVGRELTEFRALAGELDTLLHPQTRRPLHTAIRYGVTGAILDAVAKAQKRLMAQVIAAEYGTSVSKRELPIFTQSGDARHENADKMIIKGAAVLPHGLINNVKTKLGPQGEILAEYVKWLKERIESHKPYPDYQPVLHLDLYGTLDGAFGSDHRKIVSYLEKLAQIAHPLKLRIEGPVDRGSREEQVRALCELTELLDSGGSGVELVADEWCNTLEDIKYFAQRRAGHMLQIKTPDLGGINNTIEAVLYCKQMGIGTYLGGTCNETERSSQICVHIAMATEPDQILAKPGMGMDEGFMIVHNEMQRILALEKALGRMS